MCDCELTWQRVSRCPTTTLMIQVLAARDSCIRTDRRISDRTTLIPYFNSVSDQQVVREEMNTINSESEKNAVLRALMKNFIVTLLTMFNRINPQAIGALHCIAPLSQTKQPTC